jgi:multicomponent Na+:H+ antiporter subunit D
MLTLVSMAKIWVGAFWGEVLPARPTGDVGILRHHRSMAAATMMLVALTVTIAVMAGPLYEFATEAAIQMLDVATYVSAVRGS